MFPRPSARDIGNADQGVRDIHMQVGIQAVRRGLAAILLRVNTEVNAAYAKALSAAS